MTTDKIKNRKRRHGRIRSRVAGTAHVPRLSVFRSNKFIYAQLIDDENGVTLGASSDVEEKNGTKKERATTVGEVIATLAKEKSIDKVVFDRGGFLYAGRVAALAEGARNGGLQF
jgi:large subunit ribosomal protein L18